jgi:hypothetical protein
VKRFCPDRLCFIEHVNIPDHYLMNIYYKHRAKSLKGGLTSRYFSVKYIFQECCSFKTAENYTRVVQGVCREGMFF